MGKLFLKNIRLYAFHGCLGEEEKIGGDYVVNLEVAAKFDKASKTDKLKDAVDYVFLNEIVKEEMKKRANLLENVAERIVQSVLKKLPLVDAVKVSVSKQNPPVRGNVEDVSVTIKRKRN